MSIEAATAMPSAESERFQTDRVVTISAAHALHDTYTAFLPPLLPAFIESLSLTLTQAGLLSVFMQVPSLLQPFIGYLADRASLRYLVILTPAVSATAMSLLGVAPGFVVMALLLMVAGLSSAILHAVAPVMAGRLSGKNLGRGMGFWMVGGEIGRFVGPLIIAGYFLLQPDSLSSMPLLMFGGWATSLLLLVRLRDVPVRAPTGDQQVPWTRGLRLMGGFLVPLIAIITVRSLMLAALTTYLPTFLRDEGADLWFASIALSVLEAAGIVGALLGGSLSDRWGRRTILSVSLLVTPLLMLVFMALGGWLQFPLLLALGLTSLSITPVIMAMVQENFPDNRALANGVYMALSFLIRSGAVVLLGAASDLFGMRPAYYASAVVTLLGLPFIFLLPSRNR
jgi:FSR family fosmidomycin resistance protein-like MFS transporter